MKVIKTYNELKQLKTFEERFEYLKFNGQVGASTFGFDRYLNQAFYRSKLWKDVRSVVLLRDNGSDLGIEDYPIFQHPHVHHMNPILVEDLELYSEEILDPEFLITTSIDTHNALHYGGKAREPVIPIQRLPNDTSPWLNGGVIHGKYSRFN